MNNENTTKELTPKQLQFCREYLIDLNATQAAIRAGYSEKTAQEQGSRLLSNAIIIAQLAGMAKKRIEKCEISAQMVLDGIKAIAEDPDARHSDKIKAYELLGKYLKLFTDRQEVEVRGEIRLLSLMDIRQHNVTRE